MRDSVIEFGKTLEAHPTNIPGLVYYDLPVHGDSRGWFKENWQKAKMTEIGLPDFGPVQNNISFNLKTGVTRGIHAEPWDKYISVGNGKLFGAWVDLREGDTFGNKFTIEMDPSIAIFVPRGVGNSYQALEDNTVYTYLVNDHWSAEAQTQYTFLNLSDQTIDIPWPIPLIDAELSDKDKQHPIIKDVIPMSPKKILITGATGQLGRALKNDFPDAEYTTRDELDIADIELEKARSWRQYETIINAAAYTAVDSAETAEGRIAAWKTNVQAVANLSSVATKYGITLVNISSDYVFDGTIKLHNEDEICSPLGVYGQTKAAGDAIVSIVPKYYTIRTSWVVGDGNNFVKTMQALAERDITPTVVDDQYGRLSFANDISKAIKHLVNTHAEYGVYNVSNEGDIASWADIAQVVYASKGNITPIRVTTSEYYKDKKDIAIRPLQSGLNLDKIKATGFTPRNWREAITEYLDK